MRAISHWVLVALGAVFVVADSASALVTSDTAGSHVTTPGVPAFGLDHDGVAELLVFRTNGNVRCSGALLSTGKHILSAAHCFSPVSAGNFTTTSTKVNFDLDGSSKTINVSEWNVHPDWIGDLHFGNDIAVLELSEPAPADIPRYEIFRDTDLSEIGVPSVKVGVGRSGIGDTGATMQSGTKRAGLNLYDDVSDPILNWFGLTPNTGYTPGSQLAYDFDNGLAANDAFGVIFNNDELGFGDDEVFAAPGDSGGPTFVDDDGVMKIAGVHSYNSRLGSSPQPDINNTRNQSYGEFNVDTRVAHYADFVMDILISDAIPGDANLNGEVTIGDLAILSANFGTSPGPGSWELGDFNDDGEISIADLSLLSSNFGATYFDNEVQGLSIDVAAAFVGIDASAVPEPHTLAVLTISGLLAITRRRERDTVSFQN